MKLRDESVEALKARLYTSIREHLTALGEDEAAANHKYIMSLVAGAIRVVKSVQVADHRSVSKLFEKTEPKQLCIAMFKAGTKKSVPVKCVNNAMFGPYCRRHWMKREGVL